MHRIRRALGALLVVLTVTGAATVAATAGVSPVVHHAVSTSPAGISTANGTNPALVAADWANLTAKVGAYVRVLALNAYLDALAAAEAARLAAAHHSGGGGRGGGRCADGPVDYGDGHGVNDAIPSSIVSRESNGNYGACNESSGACGKYQFTGQTWNGFGGYASACDAPPGVQDEKANEVWADGAGCSHWSAC